MHDETKITTEKPHKHKALGNDLKYSGILRICIEVVHQRIWNLICVMRRKMSKTEFDIRGSTECFVLVTNNNQITS